MNDLFRVRQRDDGIVYIDVRDLSLDVLETWNRFKFRLYKDALLNGKHIRVLCDLRAAGWLDHEHIRWVAQSFHSASSDHYLRRSIAVLTDPVSLGLTEMALGRLPVRAKMNIRTFLTEQDAVHWLRSRLDETG